MSTIRCRRPIYDLRPLRSLQSPILPKDQGAIGMQTRTHSEDPANSRMAPNNNEASGVSHPAAPAHGDLPLPKSSNSDAKGGALKPSEEPAPFGAEVVGGHTVSFYHSKRGRWAPAEIVGFDPATGKHSLRIEGASGDTWAALGSSKFKWIQRRAGAEPNPSFAGSPRREDAVGRRARIFWPGVCALRTARMHAAPFACTRVPAGSLCHPSPQAPQFEIACMHSR